ncbi:MAG: recombinase family protein [Candidatus Microgenomates bacterium]
MNNKKAIIYKRVSDPGQLSGLSLDVQEEICRKWAKENGYDVVDVFEDGGKTGTKTVGRQGLEDSVNRCKQKDIDAILTIDTDRFARNELDHYLLKDELNKLGTQVIAVNQPMIDGSPEGMLLENSLIGLNAFYSRLIGRKVRKSLEKKWNDGVYPSWAPLGYKNVNIGTKDKPNRVIRKDPKIGPLITELFKLYSTGSYTYFKLCEEMQTRGLLARGGKMLCDSSVQQIISNTFYYGWMKWSGKEKMGKHKPLISKDLFDQCQFVAAKHRQFLTRERKHDFLLRGIAYCPVHNSRLTAEWHYYHNDKFKKPKIGYYHCYAQGGCPTSFIEVPKLERKVSNLLKNYQFSEKFIDLVVQKAKDNLNESRKSLKFKRQGIINKRRAVEKSRNNLEDLLTDKTIDRDVYSRQHSKLEAEILDYDNQLSKLDSQQSVDVGLIEEVLFFSRNIYKTYMEAPTYLKKHYLRFFFETIYVKNKQISKVVETPIFAALRRQNYIIIKLALLRRQDSNL